MKYDNSKIALSEAELEKDPITEDVLGHLGLGLNDDEAAIYQEQPGRYYENALSKLPVRLAVQHAILELPDANRVVVEKLMAQIEAGQRPNLNQIADELKRPYATTYGHLGQALHLLAKTLRNDPAVREYYGDKRLDGQIAAVSGICR